MCWSVAGTPGFLKIFVCGCLYVCIFVCVCQRLRLLVTYDVIWIPYDWLNKFESLYNSHLKQLYISNNTEYFSCKGGCGVGHSGCQYA